MVEYVGHQFGNYRLSQLLGEGGFAEVYLGEHIYLKVQAAIKVLSAQLTNQSLEQFRSEAQTIAHLKHPHIVPVHDFGVEGKTPFLVMEYAPNGSLRKRHPEGTPLPLDMAVGYTQQIAEALHYAHTARVIHRDIKPENMLIGTGDQILLSDFGIAVVAQTTGYQSTKDIAGTFRYMAPEQISGHPHPASDQYALAVLVYEWLAGEPPFEGAMHELVARHLTAAPPSLQQKTPSLPQGVEQVVLKALEKNPHQRFPSIQSFASALLEASKQERPPTKTTPFIVSPPRAARSPVITAPMDTVAPSARNLAPGWDSAQTVHMLKSLPMGTVHCVYTAHTEPVIEILWPRVGRQVLSRSDAATLHSWDPTTGDQQYLLTFGERTDPLRALAWSPNQESAASFVRAAWSPAPKVSTKELPAVIECPVEVFDTSTGDLIASYSGHRGGLYSLAWAPGRQRIVTAGIDRTLQVWDAKTGEMLGLYRGHACASLAVAWSPDGSRIASAGEDGRVQVWNPATRTTSLTYEQHRGAVSKVSWSPDGTWIASLGADRTVRVWDASTGASLATFRHHVDGATNIAWSPDGSQIASLGGDETVHVWDTATGTTLVTYRGHRNTVTALAWSPSGKRLASGGKDKTVQIWQATTGKRLYTYRGHRVGVSALAWSPQGASIASAGRDHKVHVWQADGPMLAKRPAYWALEEQASIGFLKLRKRFDWIPSFAFVLAGMDVLLCPLLAGVYLKSWGVGLGMMLAAVLAIGGFAVTARWRGKREVGILAGIFALLWAIASWAVGVSMKGLPAADEIAAAAFLVSFALHALVLRPKWSPEAERGESE